MLVALAAATSHGCSARPGRESPMNDSRRNLKPPIAEVRPKR
jgi:hypothetical protein